MFRLTIGKELERRERLNLKINSLYIFLPIQCWFFALAGLNIEQAVIYQTCENVNYGIHLIPQGREY